MFSRPTTSSSRYGAARSTAASSAGGSAYTSASVRKPTSLTAPTASSTARRAVTDENRVPSYARPTRSTMLAAAANANHADVEMKDVSAPASRARPGTARSGYARPILREQPTNVPARTPTTGTACVLVAFALTVCDGIACAQFVYVRLCRTLPAAACHHADVWALGSVAAVGNKRFKPSPQRHWRTTREHEPVPAVDCRRVQRYTTTTTTDCALELYATAKCSSCTGAYECSAATSSVCRPAVPVCSRAPDIPHAPTATAASSSWTSTPARATKGVESPGL